MTTICLAFFSCRSDKDRINDAKNIVESFVKDLELENFESIKKTYPNFSSVGKYWILYQFSITETKIENNVVTIYGNYKKGDKEKESIMFVLKENDKNEYFIDKSKGLSAYFGKDLYEFCKKVGCLRGLETDAEIAEACKKRENFFNEMIETYTEKIESCVKLENHNVSNSYGFVSGDVTVKNNSAINIPAFSYDLYIVLLDNNYNEIFRTKSTSNVYSIPANGSLTSMINEQSNRGMAKIGVEIKITDDSFLKEQLANPPADWDCDFVDAFVNGNIDEYIKNRQQ